MRSATLFTGSVLVFAFLYIMAGYMFNEPKNNPRHVPTSLYIDPDSQREHIDMEQKATTNLQSVEFMNGEYTVTSIQYFLNDYYSSADGWATPMIWFQTLDLGNKSYITITSDQDGESQTITPENVYQWQTNITQEWIDIGHTFEAISAFFNGSSLTVDFYKHKDDNTANYSIKELFPLRRGKCDVQALLNERNCAIYAEPPAEDNRISSSNPAVGSLFCHNFKGKEGGGTGWVIRNGLILGPGHGLDPTLRWCLFLLNKPLNDPDGTPHAPPVSDQYTIDIRNIRYQSGGLGKDWGVAEAYPNILTGLYPGQSQSAFLRISKQLPTLPHTGSVIGFGIDITPRGTSGCFNSTNNTQQIRGVTINSTHDNANTGRHYISYTGVITGKDSGSPVLLSTGEAVAINTHGCVNNRGTTFKHPQLTSAIDDYFGNGTIYVDHQHPVITKTGTFFEPYETIMAGYTHSFPNGSQPVLSIASGYYNETGTFSTPMTFTAPVGKVVIGASGSRLAKNVTGSDIADAASHKNKEENKDKPAELALAQNYPNPFNPTTLIDYSIPELTDVNISIYNNIGQLVSVLVDETKPPGKYTVRFNADNLSSGIYFYVLRTSNKEFIKQMTLIK